jgi:hypothetical protein
MRAGHEAAERERRTVADQYERTETAYFAQRPPLPDHFYYEYQTVRGNWVRQPINGRDLLQDVIEKMDDGWAYRLPCDRNRLTSDFAVYETEDARMSQETGHTAAEAAETAVVERIVSIMDRLAAAQARSPASAAMKLAVILDYWDGSNFDGEEQLRSVLRDLEAMA